ncbi:MAG TPA: hypothetical protein VKK61_01235, partial [Tepidisphaeraceae bacterium]|nr:hypothetical protein [Tepidisphaeraceae bacterium]
AHGWRIKETRASTVTDVYFDHNWQVIEERKRSTVLAWAERSQFNHFYRLAINIRVPLDQAGKTLHVGDSIEIIAPSL